MQARDIMTSAPATIGPDESLADLQAMLLAKRVGGLLEHGKLVGIVSRSDVVRVRGTEQAVADTRATSIASSTESPMRGLDARGGIRTDRATPRARGCATR
jgi:CBS domain-containing protein